jgi:hypothetical protein
MSEEQKPTNAEIDKLYNEFINSEEYKTLGSKGSYFGMPLIKATIIFVLSKVKI